jgi:hypothetical protein
MEQQLTAITMPSMILLKQQAICSVKSQIAILLTGYLLVAV